MARKKENTADWFPHYIPKKGTRVRILKQRFGATGYLAYFTLLEYLTVTDNHFLDFRNERIKLAYQSEIEADDETFMQIMDSLWRLEIIDRDLWLNEQIIWSQELVDSLSTLYKTRNRTAPSRPGPEDFFRNNRGGGGHSFEENPQGGEQFSQKNPQSRVEESISYKKKAPPEFWFKVRGGILEEKVSEYVRREFQIFLDKFKEKKLIEPTLEKMDEDYLAYSFRDENHVINSFKYVANKLSNPKTETKTSKGASKISSVLSASEKLNLPE